MLNAGQKILVLGASGLLGSTLVPHLRQSGAQVITHGFQASAQVQADLCDSAATWAMLEKNAPDVIINLAALTNVDQCEIAPQQAYLLNVKTVENIAAWIKAKRPACYLIQISSDQVYDAHAGQVGPFSEQQICLTNTYAFSKKAAELASLLVDGCALRTNFFGKSARLGRVSFSDWLANSMRSEQAIEVFDDVLFSPLSINTLVQMLGLIAKRQPRGVFNLGCREGLSKADFAFAFAVAAQLNSNNMRRATASQAKQLKAYRPKDMRMDCSSIEAVLNLRMPSLMQEITLCGRDYLETT